VRPESKFYPLLAKYYDWLIEMMRQPQGSEGALNIPLHDKLSS
jgi:hypothetical protein